MCIFTPQSITAIATSIIAVIALSISIWQGYIARTHNRLSVTPNLSIDFNLINSHGIGIELKNTGLGPAILTKFTCIFKNKEYQVTSNDDMDIFIKALNLGNIQSYNYVIDVGEFLEYGYSQFVINFDKQPSTNEFNKLKNILSGIKIKIEYKSIYNELFTNEHSYN